MIECKDFRELTADNFSLELSEAPANEIYALPFRVYQVTYDGVSAFWQLPVPNKKRGLFELKIKLCEYELCRVDRPLVHKRTLEEVWFKWIPKPVPQSAKRKEKEKLKTSTEGEADNGTADEAETPVPARALPKEIMFETLHFHGVCVRDKAGNFPCPTEGTLSLFGEAGGLGKQMNHGTPAEFVAKFNSGSSINPTLLFIAGTAKYSVPAIDSELTLLLFLTNCPVPCH